MSSRGLAGAVIAAPGLVSAFGAGYLVVLACAAFRRRDAPPPACVHRLAVVVPAHDEEALIGRCLAALRSQDYPRELVELVVVADNCGDRTAEIARDAGCTVLERDDPWAPGKGRALRWALDALLASRSALDGVVVVDADSVVAPGFLAALEARLAAGADAVQAEYLVLSPPTSRPDLRATAFRLFHSARFAGRAALGLPCALVGNGMLFSRSLLERHPWSAFGAAEDIELSMDLRLEGVGPVFAPDARIEGPATAGGSVGRTQRRRWEGGRFHAVRTRLPGLLRAAVRRRDWRLLEASLDFAIPPFGLLVLVSGAGAALATGLRAAGAVPTWAVAPWLTSIGLLPVYVLVGLRATGAPREAYVALLGGPRYLAAKVGTYVRMARSGLGADSWERSDRTSAAATAGGPAASRLAS